MYRPKCFKHSTIRPLGASPQSVAAGHAYARTKNERKYYAAYAEFSKIMGQCVDKRKKPGLASWALSRGRDTVKTNIAPRNNIAI